MKKTPKIRIPVAVNQHAGTHKDKKKELKKYACRKSRRSFLGRPHASLASPI